MAGKQVVSEFTIEMGFSEKVMKGLAKLEKQVMPVANRMEQRLNKVFAKDYSRNMRGTFAKIEKMSASSARVINRNLNNAFKSGQMGNGLFNRYQTEGIAAARAVRKALAEAKREARLGAGDLGGLGNGAGRRRTPRNPAGTISNLDMRQRTSAQYGNMIARDPAQAREYARRLTELRNTHLMGDRNVETYRQNLRQLNFEFAQQARVARAAGAAQRAAAGSAGAGLGALAESVSPLVAGFFALQKAMDFFKQSLEVGAAKTQANTMTSFAFGANGANAKQQILEQANKYGQNETAALEQASTLRATIPRTVNDDKIIKYMEDAGVFAHLTGAKQDQVERMNYGLSQAVSSDKLIKQDFRQIVSNMPGIVQPMLEFTKTKNANELFEYLKNLKDGGKVFDVVAQSMQQANIKANAYKMAMDNIISVQGRFTNAVQHDQFSFFSGFEQGFSDMTEAGSQALNDATGLFYKLGQAAGWLFQRITPIIQILDVVAMNVDGYLGLIRDKWQEFFNGLPQPIQNALNDVGNALNGFLSGAIAIAGTLGGLFAAAKVGAMVKRLLGLGDAMSTASGAGGGLGGIVGKLGQIAMIIDAGVTLGNYLFDSVIPKFQKWAYGDENGNVEYTNGGNTVKGSLAEKGWNMISGWFGDSPLANGNWSGATSPGLPGMNGAAAYATPQPLSLVQPEPMKIQLDPFTINIPMPDGSMHTATVSPVVREILGDTMMMTQGTGGNWQSTSQNAGWSPSLLARGSN
ncbi:MULTISPECIES: hypothetical protein [unclassified Leclercia]|uniref:Uncharacterized protein n=1 Tax=Leclercia barmai TaxID=2785629 RepID=A0ABS7RT07_9ENTR|nr:MULTISPECIES: hypothetical protein [unclassified Leclercia]MBZ0057451.1 hypothetical protein [Leclercia sp. EMC7]MCM5695615.1 hypothetical protein [Leclercia sp. LTM01]MCM5700023.1 hypothetical protein [Leclercia sp. LTM14]